MGPPKDSCRMYGPQTMLDRHGGALLLLLHGQRGGTSKWCGFMLCRNTPTLLTLELRLSSCKCFIAIARVLKPLSVSTLACERTLSVKNVHGRLKINDNGALIIAGGQGSNISTTLYNDVWISRDGATWSLVTAAAGWSRRYD